MQGEDHPYLANSLFQHNTADSNSTSDFCVFWENDKFLSSRISRSPMSRMFLKAVFHFLSDNKYTFSFAFFFS